MVKATPALTHEMGTSRHMLPSRQSGPSCHGNGQVALEVECEQDSETYKVRVVCICQHCLESSQECFNLGRDILKGEIQEKKLLTDSLSGDLLDRWQND